MDSSIPTDLKSRISELQKYLTDGDPHQPSLSVDALLDGVLALYNEVRQLEKQSEGVGKFVKKCMFKVFSLCLVKNRLA